MNERPTPMTSAIIAQHHKRRVEAGIGALDHGSIVALIGALAFHSEALERLCAELAEVAADPCPYHFCGCDLCLKRDDVMARYTAMKEGK